MNLSDPTELTHSNGRRSNDTADVSSYNQSQYSAINGGTEDDYVDPVSNARDVICERETFKARIAD